MLKLNIKNFRSIENIEINVNKSSRLVGIIGPNDSGKSNIILAIKELRKMGEIDKSDYLMKYNENLDIEQSADAILNMELVIDNHENNKIKERLLKNDDYKDILNEIDTKARTIKMKKGGSQNSSGIYGISTLSKFENFIKWYFKDELDKTETYIMSDGTFNHSYRKSYFISRLKYNKDKIDQGRFQDMLDLITIFSSTYNQQFRKINIKEIKESNFFNTETIDLNILNDDDDANMAQRETLRRWLSIFKIEASEIIEYLDNVAGRALTKKVSLMNKRIISTLEKINTKYKIRENIQIECQIISNFLYINFRIPDKINGYFVDSEDISKRGQGLKWFLQILFEFMATDKDRPTIFLLDEPSNKLNPIYQDKLLQFMDDFIDKRKNIIIIYTTHSNHMLNEDLKFGHRVVYREKKHNSTKITQSLTTVNSDETNASSDIESVISGSIGIDYMSASVLKSKWFFLVEGISDYYFFKKIFEINEINDVFIYIIEGSLFHNSANKLMSYILNYEKNVMSIFDGDAAGNKYINILEKYWDKATLYTYSSINGDDVITLEDNFGDDEVKIESGNKPISAKDFYDNFDMKNASTKTKENINGILEIIMTTIRS